MHPLPENLVEPQQLFAEVSAAAAREGRELAAPPERSQVQSCCGRGCDPCIFTVYYAALHAWYLQTGAPNRMTLGTGHRQ